MYICGNDLFKKMSLIPARYSSTKPLSAIDVSSTGFSEKHARLTNLPIDRPEDGKEFALVLSDGLGIYFFKLFFNIY